MAATRDALLRWPAGLVTGVGSLPGPDLGAAMRWVADGAPELPFAPELPAAGGGMIDRVVPPELRDSGVELRDPAGIEGCPVEAGPGTAALRQAASNGAFPAALACKTQLAGPLTVGALLRWRGAPAIDDPGVLAILGGRVAALAEVERAELAKTGLPTVVWIDEPMLGLLSAETLASALPALASVIAALRGRGAIVGLHCCSSIPWVSVAKLDIDILSFDPAQEHEQLLASSAAQDLAQRVRLAWGLVPTDRDPRDLDAARLVEAWRARLAPGLDPAALASRALVSASCGLAGLPPDQVGPSFALARAVGARMAALASGQDP